MNANEIRKKETISPNPTQETQGKTTNSIINQPQSTEKILRIMTGALSGLDHLAHGATHQSQTNLIIRPELLALGALVA